MNKYYPFNNRDEKAKFISKTFKKYLKYSILDVGCGNRYLKKYIPKEVNYIGIDIGGNPDYVVDLEGDKLNKFKDNQFFIVICIDVLEHLDNLHEIFDEICRVSKRFIIISVPNCWRVLKFIVQGNQDFKFYGIPINKPVDRHKWFFNYEQALNFFEKRGEKNNFKTKYHFQIPLHVNSVKNKIYELVFRFLFRKRIESKNLHSVSLWVLLERIIPHIDNISKIS